jgi:hypothetical protein
MTLNLRISFIPTFCQKSFYFLESEDSKNSAAFGTNV